MQQGRVLFQLAQRARLVQGDIDPTGTAWLIKLLENNDLTGSGLNRQPGSGPVIQAAVTR